jgi:ribosomal protein S18 acetylase RimI-like enzyme
VSHDYTLRVATAEDYDFLYQLHAATIRPAVEATWGWDEAYQVERFRQHFVAGDNQIIVAGDEDVGVLKLEERDGDCFLGLIEIAPPYQGRGLATEVIRNVMAGAFGRGQAVVLHVLKANPGARRLYERLGFQVVERREERYVLRATPPSQEQA